MRLTSMAANARAAALALLMANFVAMVASAQFSNPGNGDDPMVMMPTVSRSPNGDAYASCALSALDANPTGSAQSSSISAALSSCYASVSSAAGGSDGPPYFSIQTQTDLPSPAPTGSPAPSTSAPTTSAAAATSVSSTSGASASTAAASTSAPQSNSAARARPPGPGGADGKRVHSAMTRLVHRVGALPLLLATVIGAGAIIWFMDELLELLVAA